MAKKHPSVRITRPREVSAPEEGAAVREPLRLIADTGLLWWLNCMTLHPIGFGLVIDPAAEHGFRLMDYRANPIQVFGPEDYEAGKAKWDAYLEKVGRATMARRRELLGFTTQPRPEV